MNPPKFNNRRKWWNIIDFVEGKFSRFSHTVRYPLRVIRSNSSLFNLIVLYSISVTDSDGHERGCGDPLVVITWVVLYCHVMHDMQD